MISPIKTKYFKHNSIKKNNKSPINYINKLLTSNKLSQLSINNININYQPLPNKNNPSLSNGNNSSSKWANKKLSSTNSFNNSKINEKLISNTNYLNVIPINQMIILQSPMINSLIAN